MFKNEKDNFGINNEPENFPRFWSIHLNIDHQIIYDCVNRKIMLLYQREENYSKLKEIIGNKIFKMEYNVLEISKLIQDESLDMSFYKIYSKINKIINDQEDLAPKLETIQNMNLMFYEDKYKDDIEDKKEKMMKNKGDISSDKETIKNRIDYNEKEIEDLKINLTVDNMKNDNLNEKENKSIDDLSKSSNWFLLPQDQDAKLPNKDNIEFISLSSNSEDHKDKRNDLLGKKRMNKCLNKMKYVNEKLKKENLKRIYKKK